MCAEMQVFFLLSYWGVGDFARHESRGEKALHGPTENRPGRPQKAAQCYKELHCNLHIVVSTSTDTHD